MSTGTENPLEVETEWKHTRTTNNYKITGLPRIKVNAEWCNGVLYESIYGEAKQFVRTHTDFIDSFSFVRFL